MKRYIIEFANDIIREAEKNGRNDVISAVSKIVVYCEWGTITRFETMKLLTEESAKAGVVSGEI